MPARKNKRKSVPKSSDNGKELNPNDTAFFEALMNDPEKKKLVLQLLSQEKETIAEYKRNAGANKQFGATTPLKRVKQKDVCESPTALMRRRALEKQQNGCRNSPLEAQSASSCTNSRESVSSSPSPVSFENLLRGVIGYVEIKSKDTDRSAGAKALMISMGATIRDTFTADVTHVVFKDGSFTTYQKAKLMKVHMVSVLWLEAVRRSQTRVPEKNYPALGTEMFDNNISSICSQLQKEYEDVVREDVRRSLAMGTPLPSTKSLLTSGRRQTMMTPFASSQYFSERFRLSQELPSTQDREVDGILSDKQKLLRTIFENPTTPSHNSSILASPSPEITSDDESNCGVVDGDFGAHCRQTDSIIFETPEPIEDPNIMRSLENLPQSKSKVSQTRLSVADMIVTPLITRNDNSTSSSNSKSLIGGLRKSTNMDLTVNVSAYSKTGTFSVSKENRISSDMSTNISDDNLLQKLSNSKQSSIDASKDSSTNMSKLQISESSDKKDDATRASGCTSTRSSNTNMSKLQISSESNNKKGEATKASECTSTRSSNTNMSALQVSSDLQRPSDGFEKQGVISIDSGSNMSSLQYLSSHNVSTRKHRKSCSKDQRTDISKETTDTNMSSLRVSSDLSNNRTSVSDLLHKDAGQHKYSHKSSTDTSMSNLQITSSVDDAPEKNDSHTNLVADDSTKPLKTRVDISGISSEKLKKKSVIFIKACDHNPERDVDAVSSRRNVKNNKQVNLDKQANNENQFDRNVTKRTRRRLFSKQDSRNDSSDRANESNTSNKAVKTTNTSLESDVNKSSETSSSDCPQKRKRLRKLYNPDGSIQLDAEQCDEEERTLKRRHVKKPLPCDFLDPNVIKLVPIVLTANGSKPRVSRRKTNSINISSSSEDNSPRKNPKKKPKAKKLDKKSIRYSSADEQKELASEFASKTATNVTPHKASSDLKGKDKQPDNFKTPSMRKRREKTEPCSTDSRKSARLSQRPNCTPLPIVPVHNRRSTLEFQPLTPMTSTKKKKLNARLPSIVCTKFHKDDCMVFSQIVRKLGRFVVEDEVSQRTTHLVAGEPKRTINMLRAIARGCWILKHEWLLGSLEQGKWLQEEDYEVTEFSPAVQHCRLERQAFGSSYSMDIFEGCDPIYIARSSIPRCSDLQELVTLCKGTITPILRNAKIVVGEYVASPDVTCVTETWILDCITFNKKKPLKKYLFKN